MHCKTVCIGSLRTAFCIVLLLTYMEVQPPDFNEYWQSHVLDDSELASFSSKAFCAHTNVHVYFSLINFSSQCALSMDGQPGWMLTMTVPLMLMNWATVAIKQGLPLYFSRDMRPWQINCITVSDVQSA